jgi:predicted glycosyltransferase
VCSLVACPWVTRQLEEAINSSETVIARSGYTTIMDLAKMNKKAFFIPTPGQHEQLYLAKRLAKNNLAPYCTQDEFCLKKLEAVKNYNVLSINSDKKVDFKNLFNCFERK